MATLAEQRTEVLDLLGVDSSDPFWPSAKLTRFINRGLTRVATEFDWPWLQVDTTFATVADQIAYTPPAGWRKTLSLTIDSDDLDYRQRRDVAKYVGYNATRPAVYTIVADSIKLYPAPKTVYTVNHVYIQHEPVLVADGDEPLLPDEYSDMLSLAAAIRAASSQGDAQRMATMEKQYADWKDRIDDDIRRTRAHPRVKSRDDWRVSI